MRYYEYPPPPLLTFSRLHLCTDPQEEQKDALIALVRERDEFELCVKDLKARNSWLEKQVLGSPDACRCGEAVGAGRG